MHMNSAQSPFAIKSRKDSKSASLDFEQGSGPNAVEIVIDSNLKCQEAYEDKNKQTVKVHNNMQTSFDSLSNDYPKNMK